MVSKAIYDQMERGLRYVRLNRARAREDVICGHLFHIWQRCLEEGYDIRRREPIPRGTSAALPHGRHPRGCKLLIQPAASLRGGRDKRCNGVRIGANHRASNSLLESSLVFGLPRDIVRERHAA